MFSKEDKINRTKTVFNTASDRFDAPALSFWNRFGQQTINHLSLNPGDRILDVCCGSGASAIPAAISVGSTGEVIAVDIAESLLQLARDNSQQRELNNIEFCCADFETLEFPDESFDAVVCVFGIFFVEDMSKAIQELWRMVRPGGKLAITSWGNRVLEPANQQFWNIIESERPDLSKKSRPWDNINQPTSLQTLLETAGITDIQVFTESTTHELASPEDWWTIILGSGYRGIIEQLTPPVRKLVREMNLQFLENNEIHALDVDVLYAIAYKSTE